MNYNLEEYYANKRQQRKNKQVFWGLTIMMVLVGISMMLH